MEPWEKKYQEFLNKAGRGVEPSPRSALGAPAPTVTRTVAPGTRFWRKLETGGFGHSIPLVREGGVVTPEMAAREFVERGETRAFPIDPEMQVVNLAYVAPDHPKVRQFICLEAPFVGKIYLESSPPRVILKG